MSDLITKQVDGEISISTEGTNVPIKDDKKNNIVNRVDFLELFLPMGDNDNYLTESFKMTPEGYLTGRAIVTNIGVFPYLTGDGELVGELRHPEDVLDMSSLQSLKNKVITNDHPSVLVNVENVKEHQVGFLGSDIRNDAYFVSIPLTITDKDTIKEVQEEGKRALSCGYTAELHDESGVYLGTHYSGRQKNIRYNHVAVVDRGRAGDAARMRFDSAGGSVAVSAGIQKFNYEDREDIMSLKTIVFDGVEYKAEGKVLDTLSQHKKDAAELKGENEELKKEIETLKADAAKIEAERDNLQDKITNLEKEVEEKLDEKEIDKKVDEKIKLIESAKLAEVEIKEDMSQSEIKKAVIMKVFPNANLDEKSDEYLDARYDGAIEVLEEKIDEKADAKKREIADGVKNSESEDKFDSEEARNRMIKRNYTTSRGIKEE
jgi:hypothetical protein